MIAERPADEKTTSNRYRCAAPGNGAVQAADKRSPLDEIMLDFALSSNKGPYHPDDLTNAVHYVIGTYPYPHTLTDDDTWALETNHQMLKMFPPTEYDHPYLGDLYIIKSVTKCEPYHPDPHRIACAEPHGNWCVIRFDEEQATRWGWTVNLLMRHEIGHCNGWPGNHKGAQYSLSRAK